MRNAIFSFLIYFLLYLRQKADHSPNTFSYHYSSLYAFLFTHVTYLSYHTYNETKQCTSYPFMHHPLSPPKTYLYHSSSLSTSVFTFPVIHISLITHVTYSLTPTIFTSFFFTFHFPIHLSNYLSL